MDFEKVKKKSLEAQWFSSKWMLISKVSWKRGLKRLEDTVEIL